MYLSRLGKTEGLKAMKSVGGGVHHKPINNKWGGWEMGILRTKVVKKPSEPRVCCVLLRHERKFAMLLLK